MDIDRTVQQPRMLTFTEAIARCFKRYATFSGRATRAEYWWFVLFGILLSLPFELCTRPAVESGFLSSEGYSVLSAFFSIFLFLPSLAVSVRRLHDIDFSGWWALLSLTIVGIIPLLIFYCLPGKPEANRFGVRDDGMTPTSGTNTSGQSAAQNAQSQHMENTQQSIQHPAERMGDARIIASRQDLLTLLEITALRVEQLANKSWRILLAIKNTQDFPVCLVNLLDKQQVILLDQEGFAHERQTGGESIVTVPEQAAKKVEFFFAQLDGSSPKVIRIYGAEIALTQQDGTPL